MTSFLRLIIPVAVVLVVCLLIWAGQAILEGAREGLDEANAELAEERRQKETERLALQQVKQQEIEDAAAALSLTQRQGLALRAPFTEIWLEIFPKRHGQRDERLFYQIDPPAGQEHELMTMLKDGWEITDQASALEKLRWLLNTGHRSAFTAVQAAFDTGEVADVPKRQLDIVRQWSAEVGEAGGSAFDFARAVDVAASACALGYLTPQQTWKVIHHARTQAQQLFTDWPTFGRSFLAGAAFWQSGGLVASQRNKRYATAIQWLEREPSSPWQRDLLQAMPDQEQLLPIPPASSLN